MPQEKRRRGAPKGNLNALKSGAHSLVAPPAHNFR